MSLLRFEQTEMVYFGGGSTAPIVALHTIDLTVDRGETVAVVGRSGSGKSTLAELALGLRRPTGGRILIDGELWNGPKHTPDRRRRRLVQGVAQDAGASLPPRWTVAKTLSTTFRHLSDKSYDAAATELAIEAAVDAAQFPTELLSRRPSELSGGQAQRAAIARAIVARPLLLVADEPTSAVPAETAELLTKALLALAEHSDLALIVVSHDHAVASQCRRTIQLSDGVARELTDSLAASPGSKNQTRK